jgi:regulatory LuxR family protein
MLVQAASTGRHHLDAAPEDLTNREIGDRLLLSPRTVSSHLYRSFCGRLGRA